ncbi:Carbohydrate acetyl esterase/feruloyl esterase precursor [Gimesia alba]|uniref:Carbohydrate acetyl esterase/feruloyl esterase n=1 Tax=Gimesia alba TaxID=2527973 RepID=A0A517RAP1_9PLAN|nr:alpha/beta hydrolase-fold protein [Gimesia alba]QDT40957.1 Carbohydrate acetyl esterase/feruloyl esterase precursor [Gimesia alba]
MQYRTHHRKLYSTLCLLSAAVMLLIANPVCGQQQKPKKKRPPFRWVNKLKQELPGVQHAIFRSPSMKVDVGYCIYLPPQYNDPQNRTERFPVVYYLHGGRPGSETKSVRLVQHIHKQISAGKVTPMIYVFVNGGPVSHYNMPDREHAMGEDVFVKELIPHIDATYRTIAARKGRAIEGFSQGGRGTTRIMFKYPERFCSAAPGGAGHATEKRISEQNGRESANLVFVKGDNTYDLARKYAKHPEPALRILIHVGTKGFNYQNNLAYMEFLKSLKIPFEQLIVPDVPHSAVQIYEKEGLKIMQFHADNFRRAGQKT